jgi:stage II sporulation protein D
MLARAAICCAFVAALAGFGAQAEASPFGGLVTGAQAKRSTAVFAVSGRGWGHGVGMSQWGAQGFAQRGTEYAAILAHYYRGTELGRAPVARVRVLLTDGKKALRVSSDLPLRVRDGSGELHDLEAGTYALGPGLRLRLAPGEQPTALRGPLLFSATSGGVLRLDAKPYRGQLEVAVERGRLRAINHVGLEAYLYGVVPDEMPHTWHPEALKAQAVVARSYALAVRRSGGAFDLYDDVRSQVYNGITAEETPSNAAVDATAGQVLLYDGAVARTFFFSTSGGRTASVADVWGGAPIPYLVSVEDPYDAASPHHRWGPVPITAARMKRALAVPGEVVDVRTTLNSSRRVDRVTGTGTVGEGAATGAELRTRLGLRSTWFSVGVLSLARATLTIVPHGSATRLNGLARGFPGRVLLEARATGGAWAPAGGVPAGAAFALDVKPTLSTEYRLAAGTIRTDPLRVVVAPRVRLAPPAAPTALNGTVRPVLSGVPVVIQRRAEGGRWRRVALARLDDAGRFEAQLELVPGTYRARVAPGRGFAVGISPALDVVAP